MFNNATLLITGGTGSFGGTVLKRFLNTDIREIRVFSRDEEKQHNMRESLKDSRVKFYIGDVRDYDSVEEAMIGVDYVFHAAALKQVPSCEFYPMEAVKTNVIGTSNVLDAAVKASVKKVICLSTDKAVYPVNAMGLSKAMMEKVMVAKARTVDPKQTLICATRYGNVMASRGSIIPLFIDQIKANKPLTITNPQMTRFIMSLDDAVELVLFAYEHALGGDIFVQKSPACTIESLAAAVLKVFGVERPIQIIGTRHGEKFYESLLTQEEFSFAEDLGGYFRVAADNRDLNYAKYFTTGDRQLNRTEDYNSTNTVQLNVDEVVEKLLELDYIQEELRSWKAVHV